MTDFWDSVFYSVNYFNCSSAADSGNVFLQFYSASVHNANSPPYLQCTPQRNACRPKLLFCPISFSDCGQTTTQDNKARLRWL